MSTTTAARPATRIDYAALEITGRVLSVRQFSDDGFVVIALDGDRSVVGELTDEDSPVVVGVTYRWFGRWGNHERYGDQFKFDSFVLAAGEQNQMGIVAYLSRSNLGLTKTDAAKLWKAYGPAAIDRLRDAPADVVADGVLGDQDGGAKAIKASELLRAAQADEPTIIALFELFASRGFPKGVVRACVTAWGARSPEIVRRNPFAMLVRGIPGVGFRRADTLYLALGGNPLRLKRQMLAAWHAMHTSGSGNTWEVEGMLQQAILKAAGSFMNGEFDRAIRLGIRAGWLRVRTDDGGTWYAERANAAAEERLARHVQRLRAHPAAWPEVTETDLPDGHQRAALASISAAGVAILAGTPGTGKTYAAAVLIRKAMENLPWGRIAVCAPTGKAAVRITEALRKHGLERTQATTIHQLLEVDGSTRGGSDTFAFRRNESRPLEQQIVVVDETSMMDTDLAASLFAAVPPGGKVLLVGDPYQLPPVGHGAPLRDVIAAGVPCAMLTEIKRNSGAIVKACAAIKDGQRFEVFRAADEAAGMNLVNIPADTEAEQLSAIVGIVGRVHTKGLDPMWDCQVLVATNEKSEVSRKNLNVVLQNFLNPHDPSTPQEARNPVYRRGDKVICLKNTQVRRWERTTEAEHHQWIGVASFRGTDELVYIANGDMGRVLAVDAKSAVVEFLLPNRVVKVQTTKTKKKDDGGEGTDRAEFDLAYAITVHKSQGSEWPVVVCVIDENAGPLGSREFWYTAISRAGRIGFLIGRMGTAYRQASRVGLQKRKTFLKEELHKGATHES